MIPTAQEFLVEELRKNHKTTVIIDTMIEFAKLHVKAALEAASNQALLAIDVTDNEYADETYIKDGRKIQTLSNCRTQEDEWCKVDENSILKAYPLENIK
jgi:hypothetical protein